MVMVLGRSGWQYKMNINRLAPESSMPSCPPPTPSGQLQNIGLNSRIMQRGLNWISSRQAATDAPFPKRLGVELNRRNSPKVAERHPSPRGTSSRLVRSDMSISR